MVARSASTCSKIGLKNHEDAYLLFLALRFKFAVGRHSLVVWIVVEARCFGDFAEVEKKLLARLGHGRTNG